MRSCRPGLRRSTAGLATLLLLAWGIGCVRSFGQVPDALKDSQRTARMRVMRELIHQIEVFKTSGRAKLVEEPLMRFSDPSRTYLDGTLWIWGPIGRPVAIMELYTHTDVRRGWVHVVQSLCDGPSTARDTAERWSEMLLRVNSINVYAIGDNARVPVERVKEPLLRFVDAVDRNESGAVWLWGRTGRPSVIVQMWKDPTDERWQFYSFTSLSTGLVTAEGTGPLRSLRWTPNRPGLEFRQLPSAPSSAAKAPARLRQMKDLARGFSAHEILDDQRFELRRLARQVHRYADPKSGLIDGAAFIWSRGSDPEIILLIELVETSATTTKWQYGLARIASAEVRVERNGKQVWRKPMTHGTRADPYFLHGEDLLYSGASR